MGIGSNVKKYRTLLGLDQKTLAAKLGVTAGAVSNYENDVSSPKEEVLFKMFEVLNVTPDELFAGCYKPTTVSSSASFLSTVSIKEIEGIKKYRALDEHGKEMVDIVLEKETNRMSEMQKHSAVVYNIASFRISRQAASAGTGVLLGPESFREVLVRRDALPRKAAFGVPVSGNSMEPRYQDGDILIISTELPETHQVGLAMMGEYGYVKIKGDGELISLNKDYAPIPMEDGAEFRGKVIGVLDQSAILEEVDDYA